ncbi:MAG: VIT domain-containing protein [Candidatus Sumerlaeia bacterium]
MSGKGVDDMPAHRAAVKPSAVILAVLFLGSGAWSGLRAQGIIIVPRPERRGEIQIERQNVRIEVKHQVARVETEQIFRNTGASPLEAEYYFPIPPDAQVSDFLMEINGEEVRGEVLERGRARHIYEDIVRRARDPALLEYEDYGLFRVRIFPVNPGRPQRVILTYNQVLRPEAGLVRLSYPMRLNRMGAPRPRPGDKGDESGFSFLISLENDAPLAAIYSPTDEITVTRHSALKATVRLEPDAWWTRRPEKDFVLYYQSRGRDFAAGVLAHRPVPDEPGWFLLLLSPPADPQDKPIARDLVFVIDTSGSMRQDDKIEQARASLLYGLDRLSPEDRFNIVSFSSFAESCFEQLVPASEENRNEARRFVSALQPGGSTNINEALQRALAMKGGPERLPMIVFITDGRPTSGVTDVDAIVRNAQAEGVTERRLFCFGLGFDVNTKLLDRLARDSRAASSYIIPGEDIEARITAFFDKIQFPALERAVLEGGDEAGLSDVYPGLAQIGDLYRGEQAVIIGRYRRAGKASFILKGRKAGRTLSIPFTLHFPEKEYRNEYVKNLWAGRKIAALLDIARLEGETEELREEIIALSAEFGIPTPYTSYLITEPEDRPRLAMGAMPGTAPAGVGPAGTRFPTGRAVPADQTARATVHSEIRPPAAGVESFHAPAVVDLSAQTGEAAVTAARQIADLTKGRLGGTADGAGFIRAAGKTFVRTPDGWRDEALTAQHRIVRIKYLSDAYFALLRARPGWKQLGRLGEVFAMTLDEKLAVEVSPDAGVEQLPDDIQAALK